MIFLFNPGHGGFVNGKYVTAPNKMHRFDDGTVAYEGAINRSIVSKCIRGLERVGLPAINICPTHLDVPLHRRLDIINAYANEYGYQNCLLIDHHSNAGGGKGVEIYTTRGQTRSDKFATVWGTMFKSKFPQVRFRADTSDGDVDKESQFYLIRKFLGPAILPELLFFDDKDDFRLLISPSFQDQYADFMVEFCHRVNQLNI